MKNNKSGPKIPKSVLNKVNNAKLSKNSKLPETADEFLIQAIEDEESGDRWYSSDLLKSLRFYQRAYDGYLKSLELDSNLLDSYYNLSRLLFHVNNNFVKVDQIKLNTLENISQCFGNVIQELQMILQYFEYVMGKFESLQKKSWDLIYNSALIYQEFIDESSDLSIEQVLQIGSKSMALYQEYLMHQISELSEIVNFKEEEEEEEEEDVQKTSGKNEINEYEIITPSVVLETITSAYKLIQSIYESATSKDEIMVINVQVNNFLEFLNSKAELIFSTDFGNSFNSTNEIEAKAKQMQELKNMNEFIKIFNLSSLKEIIEVINSLELQGNSGNFEFYTSSSDLLLSIISNSFLSPELNWEAYSLISTFFKKAEVLLSKEFANTGSNSDVYSAKISLILKLMISRSDVEFQRSTLASSDNNKQLLLKNSFNLLKNLITWTNKNGGLRENIIDQLNRIYLRKKAMLRLSILENGNIDGVLKDRTNWTTEIEELKESYNINDI